MPRSRIVVEFTRSDARKIVDRLEAGEKMGENVLACFTRLAEALRDELRVPGT